MKARLMRRTIRLEESLESELATACCGNRPQPR